MSTTTPINHDEELSPEEGAPHVLDPHLAESLAKDPVYQFIAANWKNLLLTVAGAFAIVYVYNTFQSTYSASMQRAAASYQNVRETYLRLVQITTNLEKAKAEPAKTEEKDKEAQKQKIAGLEKERDEVRRKLDEGLLVLSDEREPYKNLSSLYRGLVEKQTGSTDAALSALQGFDWMKASSGSSARFVSELGALARAKLLLDSPDKIKNGREEIKALAQNGEFVNVAAALTLYRTSSSPEERQDAQNVLNALRAKHPEQGTLIDEEIASS